MEHLISMITKPGNLIELKDISEYTTLDPFHLYGRAFYIKRNDVMFQFNHLMPLNAAYNVVYTLSGSYVGTIYFFPWYDSTETYVAGEIVAYGIQVGTVPGGSVEKGEVPTASGLFVANASVSAGETPQSSAKWEFLDDDTSLAQCEASVALTTGVKKEAYLDILTDGIVISKTAEYQYQIIVPGTKTVEIYKFTDWLNNGTPVVSQEATDEYVFDSSAYTEVPEIFIVKITVEGQDYYGVIYEITAIVNAVNYLVRVMYCIDNDDEDCRGVTTKQEERARKDMNTIMALWQSLFWKMNHSYATSIFVGNLSENAVTLLQEIGKELKRLQVTIENVDYDTI